MALRVRLMAVFEGGASEGEALFAEGEGRSTRVCVRVVPPGFHVAASLVAHLRAAPAACAPWLRRHAL